MYLNATDRQTDRQTDIQTDDILWHNRTLQLYSIWQRALKMTDSKD